MSRVPDSLTLALLIPLLAGCDDGRPPTANAVPYAISESRSPESRSALHPYVAMGYSISRGFMDGGVYHETQVQSWPAQLAQLAGILFTQPLIAAPGCQPPLMAPLSTGVRVDGSSATAPTNVCSPLLPGITAPTQNLALTGALAEDALNETPETAAAKRPFRGVSYSRVLGPGQTQVTAMRSQSPRFVSVDLDGSELIGARQGLVAMRPAGSLVSYTDWSAAYDQVIQSVKESGARALLVAFASDFASLGGLRRGHELFADRMEFFGRHVLVDPACGAADRANLVYVPDKVFAAVAAGRVARAAGLPPATLSCANVPGRVDGVLTPAELSEVNAMQARMNDHVREVADANGFAFVSYDALLARRRFKPRFNLASLLDSDMPYGPLLGLDDLHPNGAGSRIMARAAARALNRTYNTWVSVDEDSDRSDDSQWSRSVEGGGDGDAAPATLRWQQTARDLVVKHGTDPLVATRGYALLSMARYAAATSVAEKGGRRGYESQRGAVIGASAAVLTYLFPTEASSLEKMVREQAEQDRGAPHPQFARGETAGRVAADHVIARARSDGFDDPWTGQVPVGEGLWVSTGAPPARPMFARTRTFFLASGNQFRPAPPPAYGSPQFVAALTEVSGISSGRTAEQLATAQFWALRPGTITTQGYWDQQAADRITAGRLNELQASYVLALLDAAAADAAIACWDAKYTYWLLRPSHAAAAFGLPPITLPIGLPSHPSYPSGHSCVSGSSAEILGQLFPTDAGRFAALAVEAGRSRVYAGIHYQFDADAGLALGRETARFAATYARTRGVLAAIW